MCRLRATMQNLAPHVLLTWKLRCTQITKQHLRNCTRVSTVLLPSCKHLNHLRSSGRKRSPLVIPIGKERPCSRQTTSCIILCQTFISTSPPRMRLCAQAACSSENLISLASDAFCPHRK